MENSKSEELISGLVTAFIDQFGNSNLAYRPEFVYNDHKQGKKVLVSLEQELKRCDEFFISNEIMNPMSHFVSSFVCESNTKDIAWQNSNFVNQKGKSVR